MNTERCRGCVYWKSLNGGPGECSKACHYLLETGLRREREGDRCLCRKAKCRTKGGQLISPQKGRRAGMYDKRGMETS